MTTEPVTLASGRCLIDVEPQSTTSGQPQFVARMSVVDAEGSVVRPLVGPDGRRIKIHATSERMVIRVAKSYLEGRFGRIVSAEPSPSPAPSLGGATVGAPFVTS